MIVWIVGLTYYLVKMAYLEAQILELEIRQKKRNSVIRSKIKLLEQQKTHQTKYETRKGVRKLS
jgi:hypothetical protein